MICDKCKTFFVAGNRPSGVPNGIKMILKDGRTLTLCADCVMAIPQMNEQQKEAFFKEYTEGKEEGK